MFNTISTTLSISQWLAAAKVIMLAALLSACGSMPQKSLVKGPDLARQDWDKPSEVFKDLVNLPQPKGKIVASIYSFRDLTGQYKPAPSSSFSTAVTQGAAAMLLKAAKDSNWFSPLEREGLQDLLTERKIIRAALKNRNPEADVPPLIGANIIFEGGIIGYESNMKTGGSGAKYFGIGVSDQYRVDQVTVNLRAVDVGTGRVINSVTTSRSILSRQVQGGIFRFIRFKRLLEAEAGYTRNEPVQLCLLEAIQAAVIRIIVEGVEDNSWALADAQAMAHPLMQKYGRGLAQIVAAKPASAQPAPQLKPKPHADVKTSAASKPLAKSANPAKPKLAPKPASKRSQEAPTQTAQSPLAVQDKNGQWVIQLMSSTSSLELMDFVRKNKIPRDMIEYIHYRANGVDRFAILYGRFRNKVRALNAVESLPPRLRIYEPWVREHGRLFNQPGSQLISMIK